ncbi:MAG: hypothetical protein U0271_11100 [Polyangiaceae bacterium]
MTVTDTPARRGAKKPSSDELRIVDQARSLHSLDYHFACGDSRLTLRVERAPTTPETWRIEATGRVRVGVVPSTATATGVTKIEALHNVAAAWSASRVEPLLAWDTIENLLQQVRAL